MFNDMPEPVLVCLCWFVIFAASYANAINTNVEPVLDITAGQGE